MAKQVPIDAPWTAKRADEWDARSVASWLEHSGIRTTIARDLFEMAVAGLFTGDLNDVSLLHLLFLVRGAREHQHVVLDRERRAGEHGRGRRRIDRTAHRRRARRRRPPERAGALDHAAADHVVVEGRRRVSAAPRRRRRSAGARAGDRVRSGAPPRPPRAVPQHVAGPETKTLVVYDQPFWRRRLQRQTSEPSRLGGDDRRDPAAGTPGVIASFTFGPVAERVDALDRPSGAEPCSTRGARRPARGVARGVRRDAVVEEQWTRGCSMAHIRPGISTRYGPAPRAVRRVHWAGTETATTSHGAIDGAVRSGERAAAEILDRT